MSDQCSHTIGRSGVGGVWCDECGLQTMAVHNRPCKECRHYSPDGERVGICRRHLMRVTAGMNVTYWLVAGPGRSGLCFEAEE